MEPIAPWQNVEFEIHKNDDGSFTLEYKGSTIEVKSNHPMYDFIVNYINENFEDIKTLDLPQNDPLWAFLSKIYKQRNN